VHKARPAVGNRLGACWKGVHRISWRLDANNNTIWKNSPRGGDFTVVAHLAPRTTNCPDSSLVGQWRAQRLAVLGNVMEVEAVLAPCGARAGGSSVTVRQAVEAAPSSCTDRLRRRAGSCRGAAVCGHGGQFVVPRKDFDLVVRVWRGKTSTAEALVRGARWDVASRPGRRRPTTRLVRDDVGHPRPELLVHGDATARRALSVLASRPRRRGHAPVIPVAERETDDKLRRPTSPPPCLPRAAAALASSVRRGLRRGRRMDLAHIRGGVRRRCAAHDLDEGAWRCGGVVVLGIGPPHL
jgi:hypothetical protein